MIYRKLVLSSYSLFGVLSGAFLSSWDNAVANRSVIGRKEDIKLPWKAGPQEPILLNNNYVIIYTEIDVPFEVYATECEKVKLAISGHSKEDKRVYSKPTDA